MGDIFDVIDRFWGISNNKAISIDIISIVLLGMAFWNFKRIRHPRYRWRIIIVVIAVLININAYLMNWIRFDTKHLLYLGMELLILAAVIVSTYTPIVMLIPLLRLKVLIQGGFNEKAEMYLKILRYTTLTTAARFSYKQLQASYYAKKHMDIKAYNTLYNYKQNRFFESEKNIIETNMTYYLISLGNINAVKKRIEKISEPNPFLLLLTAKANDISGESTEEIMHLISKAKDQINPKTNDFIKAQIYATYSNCRRIQGNYEDALFYIMKSLEHALISKKSEVICNVYEQLISLMCSNNPSDERIRKYYDEYVDSFNQKEPVALIRICNFSFQYFRMRNEEQLLLPLVANSYTRMIDALKGIERYNWEVSGLDVAQHAMIHIANIMSDVKRDFNKYFTVSMPS